MEKLLELRGSGYSFRRISQIMGLAYSTVRRAYWASQDAPRHVLYARVPRAGGTNPDRRSLTEKPPGLAGWEETSGPTQWNPIWARFSGI